MSARITLVTSTAMALGLAFLATTAVAQSTTTDAPQHLGRIIVGYSADGTPVYGGENESSLEGLALTANGGFLSLDEVVRQTPGVSTLMNEGQPGVALSVRGLQGSRVNTTIEGVPQNFRFTAHNTADGFAYVDPLMLSSINMTRGASITEGGLAGAVNFRLLSAADIISDGKDTGGMLRLRYSDNGTGFAGLAAAAMTKGPVDLAFAVSQRHIDPYKNGAGTKIDTSGQHGGSLLLRGGWQANDALKLNFLGMRYDTKYMSQYKMSFAPNMPPTVLAEYQHEVKNDIYQLGFAYEGDEMINLSGTIYSGKTSHEHVSGRGTALGRMMETDTSGVTLKNVSTADIGGWTLTSTNGIDYAKDKLGGKQNAAGLLEGVNPVRGNTKRTSVYSENVFANGPYEVMLGLRYSDYSLSADLEGKHYDVKHDSFDPKLSLAYQLNDDVQAYISTHKTSRAPTIQESFLGGGDPSVHDFGYLGNPDLRPETSKGYELGFNIDKDNVLTANDSLSARINYFNLNVSNYIYHRMIEDDPSTTTRESGMQFINVGEKIKSQGLELELAYDADRFSAVLAWAHTDAKYAGGRLQPKDAVSATVAGRFMDNDLTVGTTVVYNSNGPASIAFEDTNGRGSYTTIDIFANYNVTENFLVSAKVANITDKLYTPWAATKDIGAGRTAYLSGEIRF